MALFKVSKGTSQNLPANKTEGYCWYTYDDSKFYIDFKDEKGVLTRKALNAQEAEKLTGYDIETILNSSDVEIPTSKAVLDALNDKMDKDNPTGTGAFSMHRKSGTDIGLHSVAIGYNNTASGKYSAAHGFSTVATGESAHTEGNSATASGYASHAEGAGTKALAGYSHAEGYQTTADAMASHTEGYNTKAVGTYQHVQGKYNIANSTYAHIVGNGEDDNNRSNAHTVKWDGTGWFAGDVKVGGTGQDDTNAKTLATTEYINNALPQVVTASSTDGATYTATVSNITALTAGVSFIMKPSMSSTSGSPTLNVNNLGAKFIRRAYASNVLDTTATNISANVPHRVTYNGTYWIVEGMPKYRASDLDGIVPITKGGTNATNAADALKNLGIYIGPDEPTDANIKIWINTSEEGTGVVPVLPRIATITLRANAWTGSANPWSQAVTVNGVSANSKIDLQPTAQQIVALQNADIALMAENNNGVVTVYALGGKPTVDYTMQVLITEVAYV